jgi:hypothetical protein
MKATVAVLFHQLTLGEENAVLIQECWIHGGQIRGKSYTMRTVFFAICNLTPRSYIYVRNKIKAVLLLEHCSRSVTVMRITCMRGGNQNELIENLVYLNYDAERPSPSREMRVVIDCCSRRRKQLIIHCGAIAYHFLSGE